jgi:hypothetical protein
MATVIRDVSGSELRLFGEIVARLERLGAETDARAVIFNDVIRLLRGDFGASYVWNARKNLFDEAVSFNMAPSNLRRYEEWYQFRDPMTFELRARRRATLVDEVIPRGKLVRTEFYNDFLARSICSSSRATATSAIFVFGGRRAVRNFARAISICSMGLSRICGARCCAAAAAAH